jgi:hypothetical protein
LIVLNFFGPAPKSPRHYSRREVLSVGALTAVAGLSLGDVLRLRANSPEPKRGTREKSVILIWMRGGPSHIDSYDMKPNAPEEVRGEFKSISTNVPGIQICEHMPLQAKIMDRLAIVRGIKSNDLGDHTPHYIVTGFPDRGQRPAIGSVVSYLRPTTDGLPRYVSMMYEPNGKHENATYTGPAHRPFVPKGEGLANLSLSRSVSVEQLGDRKELLREFDSLNRKIDAREGFAAHDAFNARALEMIASPRAREAFDLKKESAATIERYGKFCENFLLARRLVEAGVSVVTLKVGDWDTHEHTFRDMKEQLPQLDRGFHALVTDLYERGLDQDVAVVLWGEFGRTPKIDTNRVAGRDHWPEAGAAVIAGGGFRTGQVIGETDSHGGHSKGMPYTPANVLATVYRHLGIDPKTTIPDHARRPMHVLDDREGVRELI